MGPEWTAQAVLPDQKYVKTWASNHHFGGGLYENEVRYYMEHEWAYEADDILWRRTKKGLWMSAKEREALGEWLKQNR